MAIFHLHLSPETRRQKIQNRIIKTHVLVEECPDGFVEPKQLSKLGIHVDQVSLIQGDLVKFKPCFFLPSSSQTIRTYLPITPHDHSQNVAPDEEETEPRRSSESSMSMITAARRPFVLDICRGEFATALGTNFCLDNLTVLRDCGATSKGKWQHRPDLELFNQKLDPDRWEILRLLEDVKHEVPHAVFDIHQELEVEEVESLTAGEIKAIVRVMAVRMGLTCYQKHILMPILVISYLNPRQGRILQAHHDGKRVVIQHTQLFEFGGLAYRSVELFLRYYCSQPVGVTISK
ncbi:hypothetical protein BO71DRAFT_88004 [Aspergillus ellipticus CBS 707.79]|uniref:Uncharacterized protein n=1 Tax=Aspergillus ellipticus CBS 707.79 TaxID=1448320 RepID=A0A319F0J3_9EURO|nr:hypothetical protein BO71DRAFT_88004 [Aspergillus ellipticus CBS 707.79]